MRRPLYGGCPKTKDLLKVGTEEKHRHVSTSVCCERFEVPAFRASQKRSSILDTLTEGGILKHSLSRKGESKF